jgi:hypothetical protein
MTRPFAIAIILALLLEVASVRAEPPTASYIFPAGGQRGKTVDFRVGGLFLNRHCSFEMLGAGVRANHRLERTNTLWLEGPLLPLPDSQQAEDYPKDMAGRVEIASDAALGVRNAQVWTAQGVAPTLRFLVGDLPEIIEQEHEGKPLPFEVRLPVTINGRIFPRENVDIWSFKARRGQVIRAEVVAARLGSPLDAHLEVRDAQGRRLAENDDAFGADPFIQFTAPKDDTYEVRIRDIGFKGGQAYVYRLTLTADDDRKMLPAVKATVVPFGPDYRLHFTADSLAVERGKQASIKVLAERQNGFAAPIALTVEGLPPGVTALPAQVAAQQTNADIVLKVDQRAKLAGTRLAVRGTAQLAGHTIMRTGTVVVGPNLPELDTVLLVVTIPTPFKVVGDFDMGWAPRGTVYHRHYHVNRGGFKGPIEISLSDHQMRHLQGVTGPAITLAPTADSFDYPFQLPPWMEIGRTARACVMATGTYQDADGSRHELTYCSVNPNEQMVAVIGPGRLDLETDRSSLLAVPGKTVSLSLRVARARDLTGAVKIELIVPHHIHGISADPLTIPAQSQQAELAIHFARDLHGPINSPLLVRATVMAKGEPVMAEAKVDLIAEK